MTKEKAYKFYEGQKVRITLQSSKFYDKIVTVCKIIKLASGNYWVITTSPSTTQGANMCWCNSTSICPIEQEISIF